MTKISLVTEGGWPLPWLSYCVASFTLLSNPSAHAALWPGGLASHPRWSLGTWNSEQLSMFPLVISGFLRPLVPLI